ncbi:MAG: TIGR02300 family protein [Alphaproteobacteria bacterium]|nr:TIGR02300 family protein [Alphaproteobacteria bacterium]
MTYALPRGRFGRIQRNSGRFSVVKATWGTKRTCQSCAARFYDLNKSPIKCPKCGREHDREDFVKVRRGRGAAAAAAATAAAATAAAALIKAAAKKKADDAGLAGDELPDVEGDDALEADDLADETDDIEVEVEVEDDKGEGDR